MGLERVAAVMQGVHSNYDIDLFRALLQAAADVFNIPLQSLPSLQVIADHIRSCSFLIMDGILPSNEGRGYVLRRIIRRAVRHGHKLGAKSLFFYRLVAPLVVQMGEAYPELKKAQSHIEQVLKKEEEQFSKTLDNGLKVLEEAIKTLKTSEIPGECIFKLYDTYGFPPDLTADIARERALTVDLIGFEQEMDQQRVRARQSQSFSGTVKVLWQGDTTFVGYDTLESTATVLGLYQGEQKVEHLTVDQPSVIILDKTPFYAEAGGQVGDGGVIESAQGLFEVHDTQKVGNAYGHSGVLKQGKCAVGDRVQARVNAHYRSATRKNHSATHLLQAALTQLVGSGIVQKGSLVNAEKLRFDFTHGEALSAETLAALEVLVNQKIQDNTPVETAHMPLEEAMKSGATALFGEKYGAKVRVLSMANRFSVELCGGTHVGRTGDIGFFKIVSEAGIASGIRRIEAVTGPAAVLWVQEHVGYMQALSGLLKIDKAQMVAKVSQLLDSQKKLEKQLGKLTQQVTQNTGIDLLQQAWTIQGVKCLAAEVPATPAKALRQLAEQLKQKLGKAAVVLGCVEEGKITLMASVTPDVQARVSAVDLVNFVAVQVGGKGGGRPDMAQAGGVYPEKLENALKSVKEFLTGHL
jgi:alanyl-tRNA synthetase